MESVRIKQVSKQTTLNSSSDFENLKSPKQLTIKKIKAKQASLLNERWHSKLPKIHWSNIVRNTHYVCYGFYFKDYVVGVGIWSSPVAQNRFKNGKEILELRRLALSEQCPKNTASRVIALMIKEIEKEFPEINRLISYQDTSVHSGTIYAASNWHNAQEIDFISWNTNNRNRNKDQSTSKKIRWEYFLKNK